MDTHRFVKAVLFQ